MCLGRVSRSELQTIGMEVHYYSRVQSFWPGFGIVGSVFRQGWKRSQRNAICPISAYRHFLGAMVSSVFNRDSNCSLLVVASILTKVKNNRSDHGGDICYEEKSLESCDRSRFYHLPVLFECLHGRI